MLQNSVENTLKAIEGYLASKADHGDDVAKNLRALLVPMLADPDTQELRDYTVLAAVAMEGELKIYHVRALDGFHAFGVVAHEEKRVPLEFLASLAGHYEEGALLTLPGEGIVCSETVLEQTDVFGAAPEDSDDSAGRPGGERA